MRKRNRLQRGQEHLEVTQRQLAAFRRETVTQENVLRQQRRDREAAAAFTVLEGGRDHAARAPAGVREAPLTDPQEMMDEPLLVLHRYQP